MTRWADYLAHGWRLVAIAPGRKGPRAEGWNKIGHPFEPQALGAGLRHAESGTCAVDVDDYDRAAAFLAEHGIDLAELMAAPESVQVHSGRAGRGKLLYALRTPLPSFQLAPYKVLNPETGKEVTYHALELRCAAKNGLTVQDVLPPSIHPGTGRAYEWRYGDPLLGHWSNLPPLPAALEALWRAQIEPAALAPAVPQEAKGATPEELAHLLKLKDPNDCGYDEWLKVGMMIHHEMRGSPAGYALWCDWSARCPKHDTTHMLVKWRSFHSDAANPVTLGSLRSEVVAAPEEFPVEAAPAAEEFGAYYDGAGEDTRPAAVARALLETRLVYLLGQDRYYFIPNAKQPIANLDKFGECGLTPRAVHMLFNPHMPLVITETKNGAKHVRRTPVEHLEESRTKLMVGALGFHPGAPRLYTEDGVEYLNRYVQTDVEALQPKPHETEAWQFLIGRIKDDLFRRWLLKFYAHALQKPGVKIQSAPLLFSQATGTGKSTLMKTIPTLLFGTQYVKPVSSEVINSRFTGVLADTWWVVLDELRTSGLKQDRVALANKLKPWITEPFIEIEKKGLDPYTIRNRVQITGTSNFSDAVQIDDEDRRWAISEMGGNTMTARERQDLYGGFLNTARAPGVLRWIFQQENIIGFDPAGKPPETAGKSTMIVAGLGQVETRIAEAIYSCKAPFDRDIVRLSDVQDMLAGQFQPSLLRLGVMLRREPIGAHKMNEAGGNFWCWRNFAKWKRCTGTERSLHQETGARPSGVQWDLSIPVAIRAAVGDDVEADSVDDLLGELAHG